MTVIAEDKVERCRIIAEVITSCGQDTDVVENAIYETEEAAKQAQDAIRDARIYLHSKLANAPRCIYLQEAFRTHWAFFNSGCRRQSAS